MTSRGLSKGPSGGVIEAKKQIYNHCVETAIASANRIYDFRTREIDRTINEYIEMIPSNIRNQKIINFSN